MEPIEAAFQKCFEQLPTGVFIVHQDTYEVLYSSTAMSRM